MVVPVRHPHDRHERRCGGYHHKLLLHSGQDAAHELTAWDLSGAGPIAILEATRRVAGLALTSGIALYAFGTCPATWAPHRPNQIIESLYLLNDGIWGLHRRFRPRSSTCSLFWRTARKDQYGQRVLELCLVTRNAKGGPAKAAIFSASSAAAGSAAANAHATGTFTIRS